MWLICLLSLNILVTCAVGLPPRCLDDLITQVFQDPSHTAPFLPEEGGTIGAVDQGQTQLGWVEQGQESKNDGANTEDQTFGDTNISDSQETGQNVQAVLVEDHQNEGHANVNSHDEGETTEEFINGQREENYNIDSSFVAGNQESQKVESAHGSVNIAETQNFAETAYVVDPDEQECSCVPYYLCQNGSVATDGTGLIDIKIKPRLCENYMDVCCDAPLDAKEPIKPPETKRQGCGFRHPNGIGFRITGATDNEAEFGEFPWMTAILKKSAHNEHLLEYQCGGSLIHDSIVLTAAHCVKAHQPQDLTVRAGEWDTQTENEVFPHKDVKVAVTVVHPEFNSGSLWNDFALLFLEEPLPLGENIDTVCLPKSGEVPLHHECFASGWGKNQFGEEGKSQVILKKVDLPIVASDKCQDILRETRLGKYYKLHHSFVCAGGIPGKDTCKGDGGGPLVCPTAERPGMYEVTGIVAWGIGCGNEVPGIYANVAYARNWIDHELAKFNIKLE